MTLLSFLTKSHTLSQYIQLEDWDAVKIVCMEHPREAYHWSVRFDFFDGIQSSSLLPIHEAFANNAPPDVIKALLIAHPESAICKESRFGRNPLHIACQFNASLDSIKEIVKVNPAVAGMVDNLGRVPIHYVCSNGCEAEKLRLLIKACHHAVKCRDVYSWLPIHVACSMGASIEAIELLYAVHPSCVNAQTIRGNTPMDLVKGINCRDKDEIIELLAQDNQATIDHLENENTKKGFMNFHNMFSSWHSSHGSDGRGSYSNISNARAA